MSPQSPAAPARVVLIDGTNCLYRAFFAIPGLRAPDGSPTNAAYGFANMLNKIVREERPDYLVVVFDAPGETFRHRLYPDYKAHRDAQPEDLSAQIPVVRELIDAYGIAMLEVPDFEADDVIAALVDRAPDDAQVAIVSTDRDLMQLVGERVSLLDGIRDRRYGPAEVEERFGVPPQRVLDVRALVGDPSDNIPGVKGIGQKGAAQLIREWGDLENLLEHSGEVKAKRTREALASQSEQARLSKRLATLRSDVPLPVGLDDLRRREPDSERLRALFERLGFGRLLDALAEPSAAAEAPAARVAVRVVRDVEGIDALVGELATLPCIALLCVFEADAAARGQAVGLAVALGIERAAYVPLAPPAAHGVELGELLERLRSCLAGAGAVAWIARDAKRIQLSFAEHGLELPVPYFDLEIAAQLIDPDGARHTPALALQQLGWKLRTWEELAGRGARAVPAAELPEAAVADWAGHEVCAIDALRPRLEQRLEADGLSELFEQVELPLSGVLARMECAGVRIDEAVLEELSSAYRVELDRLEGEIIALAGERFLVTSPKQLQRILFEKLKLPVIKKTKTGYSTDEGVLEQLAAHHELPLRILAHRRLAKLKSTYLDALPPLVDERTGRIHPTFHQLGAATGRLSSANPNVQNIPIRSEQGVRIREAFVPAVGCLLLSADYSQVELRILAHYSEDESLLEAFRRGEDVHRRTAAEVAGTEPDQVTADQRARAKAVNFGIIYGLSAFGLANQLGIATGEAQKAIDAYFTRYRGVRSFLDETVAQARERGFVQTLLGRRRYLPDLGSRNRVLRSAAERVAVNSVIQGSAADLIKRAMVAVDAALAAGGLRGRMILQVHDELVFEAPEAEIEALRELVRDQMEGVLPLRAPLVVDVGVGKNWREAH